MMQSDTDHLSDDIFSEWLDDRLDEVTRARVEHHLVTCAECAERSRALVATRDGLRMLHAVGKVPDFRLDPQGQPRRARLTPRPIPTQSNIAQPSIAMRFVSAAVALCGVLLLTISLGQAIAPGAHTLSSALDSAGGNTESAKGNDYQSNCSLTPGNTACPQLATTMQATTPPQPTPVSGLSPTGVVKSPNDTVTAGGVTPTVTAALSPRNASSSSGWALTAFGVLLSVLMIGLGAFGFIRGGISRE